MHYRRNKISFKKKREIIIEEKFIKKIEDR